MYNNSINFYNKIFLFPSKKKYFTINLSKLGHTRSFGISFKKYLPLTNILTNHLSSYIGSKIQTCILKDTGLIFIN